MRTIDYRLGELFCIVTDGFTDQIGSWDGNSKLSYGYRRLELLLAAQANASASEVTAAMKAGFLRWQGNNRQRDDVTALLFRL